MPATGGEPVAWRRAGPSQHEHHCSCGAKAGRSWSRQADKLLVATSIHEACGLRDACAAAAAPPSKCEQQWRGPGSGTGQRRERLPTAPHWVRHTCRVRGSVLTSAGLVRHPTLPYPRRPPDLFSYINMCPLPLTPHPTLPYPARPTPPDSGSVCKNRPLRVLHAGSRPPSIWRSSRRPRRRARPATAPS